MNRGERSERVPIISLGKNTKIYSFSYSFLYMLLKIPNISFTSCGLLHIEGNALSE